MCLTCRSGKFKPTGVQRTSPHESLSHKVGYKSGKYQDSVTAKPQQAHLNAVFYSSGRFGPAILIVFFWVCSSSPEEQSNPPGMYMFPQTPHCKSSGFEMLCWRWTVMDVIHCMSSGILYIFASFFLNYFYYNTWIFFHHRQHFNSIVAHLYMFRDITHASSQASL